MFLHHSGICNLAVEHVELHVELHVAVEQHILN
jgi:hypothetical protein